MGAGGDSASRSFDPAPGEPTGPKGYGWDGGFGTAWRNDPEEDLVGVLCTQVLSSTGSSPVAPDFWSGTYAALDR